MGILPILGNPKRAFSIVHVDDLVRGFYFAAQSENTVGETFFVSNCNSITWGEFAIKMRNVAQEITGRKAFVFNMPLVCMTPLSWISSIAAFLTKKAPLLSKEKLHEMSYSWVCDSSKICNLGYSPQITLEDGLLSTYKWYKENKWL
jgi:nucleoside-diphosphate-sugar epimerase